MTSEPIKFLLVDDMSDNLFALEAIIRRKGLEVLVARSGSDALDLLLVNDVSLALLDVQMPVMDGFELAELMRGVERTKHVPIIFVTAGARDPQRVFKGYESGAVDFLFKPIDPHILKSKVNVFFDLAHQRREASQIHEEMLAMNEALKLGSLRQRELIEVGDSLNVQLQSEIRERKLVEAEKEKLDQRLHDQQFYTRSLIESNIDALMTSDRSGIITDVNKQMEALTSCTRDELIGSPFKSYFTDPERAEAGINRVLSERKVTDYELTACARDGKQTVVSYNATTFYDRGRILQGVFAAARDVTERKRVETEQKRLDQRLREVNEEMQRFIYIVGHDLRSPLVNIIGFSAELDVWQKQVFERFRALRVQAGAEQDDEKDQTLRSDVEESLNFIKSSVAKMDRLIGALLKLSREGQREFKPELIDMSQLLRSTFEALAHQAQAVNAKVSIGELPTITSDRFALEQVFSNLMDNAVKYLRADVPGSIEVRATEFDGVITYEVRDNGRGIDAKDHEGIFDLFRRSGIQDRPGDGIGLAHTHALVRRLGGSINVESELDRGTVFKVTLPKKWPLPGSEMMA